MIRRSGLRFRFWVFLLSILLVLIFAGCSFTAKKTDNPEEGLAGYFPAVEGMVYQYAGEGIEFASFRREIKYINQPFVQIHEDSGGTVVAAIYRVDQNTVSLISQREEFYSEENLLTDLAENPTVKEIILKAPIETGQSWHSNSTKREIVEVDQTLEVPAGSFNDVIKVRIETEGNNFSFISYEYYAKNYGLIMREDLGEGYYITSKLKSFKKKGQSTD